MDDGTIFLFLCCTLVGGTCWYFYNKRVLLSTLRKEKEQHRKIAYALLEKSVDQRAVFRIEDTSPHKTNDHIQGVCTKITKNEIFIAVTNAVTGIDLVEKNVKIYFSISLKRKLNYFQCTTKILDSKFSQGVLLLCAVMPKSIDTGQKRNFVRVTPHKDAILALAIWPLDEKALLPAQYADLDPAAFQFRPNKSNELLLDNISGGGMRIIITRAEEQQSDIDLTLGSRLLVLVVLRSDDTHKPLPFWVVGKIRMASEVTNPNNGIVVGFSYINWAIMERGKTTPISWFPADANGCISPLASWTMRHHLEQHKIL